MDFEKHFPLGIATGKAFIGRDSETAWLNGNINSGIHTLILAPRRYGKSSLVLHALNTSKLNFVELDLQLCRSAKSVEKKIINGVESLIISTMGKTEKFIHIAKNYLSQVNKKWKISLHTLAEISIEPDNYDDEPENILTALQLLEETLKAVDKKVIFYIDEIQEITKLENSSEIQGAIRHFAQKSEYVVFVFSGSNRKLLRAMFDDSTMPLYELCDKIILNKIQPEIYEKYFCTISKKTWPEVIPSEITNQVIKLTERHPRRIYHLCLYIWRYVNQSGNVPTEFTVNEEWKKLISTTAKSVRFFLSKRNTSQLKVISYIALKGGNEMAGKLVQQAINLTSTAIIKALQALEEDDLIERDKHNVYRIIDPVIRDTLIFYEKELVD